MRANAMRNALRLAAENSVTSVAFPAFSIGAFGYPFELATDVTLAAVRDALPGLAAVRHISVGEK